MGSGSGISNEGWKLILSVTDVNFSGSDSFPDLLEILAQQRYFLPQAAKVIFESINRSCTRLTGCHLATPRPLLPSFMGHHAGGVCQGGDRRVI